LAFKTFDSRAAGADFEVVALLAFGVDVLRSHSTNNTRLFSRADRAEVEAPRSAISDGTAKLSRVNATATEATVNRSRSGHRQGEPTPGIALGTGEKPNATSSACWRRQTQ
jgi:hypothetical protein